jgi:hypothetical protein
MAGCVVDSLEAAQDLLRAEVAMSKMDVPKPPLDGVAISDRLGDINSKLRVIAMAVTGVAAENHDEDVYAISNMIFEVCKEIGDIATESHPRMSEKKMAELKSLCASSESKYAF